MPLRCIDENGNDVEADSLDERGWRKIEAENRKQRYLRMPCCNSEVVLKAPANRTRHFAHKARNNCDAKPETEVHLYLKRLARDIARQCGWNARTEITGQSPAGESWRADLYVEKGKRRGVVEIQWSGQTVEETLRRQKRYQDSGIGCIWLLRQPGWPLTRDLPAACLAGSLKNELTILIPVNEYITAHMRTNWEKHIGHIWSRNLSPTEFFQAVFEDRFRFGINPGTRVPMTVWTGVQRLCWACNQPIRMFTHLEGSVGPFKLNHTGGYAPDLKTQLEIERLVETHPEMNCPYWICKRPNPNAWIYAVYQDEKAIGKVQWEINDYTRRICNRWEVWTTEQMLEHDLI